MWPAKEMVNEKEEEKKKKENTVRKEERHGESDAFSFYLFRKVKNIFYILYSRHTTHTQTHTHSHFDLKWKKWRTDTHLSVCCGGELK